MRMHHRVHLGRRIQEMRRRIARQRLEDWMRWHGVKFRQRADVVGVLLRRLGRFLMQPMRQQRPMPGPAVLAGFRFAGA